ncbi:hypothetical protein L226DRAFT_552271 [Lentinus tigrinus ALCF2SS1-7]|uniref:uncharacterized protein n=1 Tax=Lentinus tigrinus ALCF2SS1-7 TaxID=1328758 RepID=UPI001165FC1A|nr:hypothetical protein L226DRAFT_552271 [Lentinus tigrinus ALCF2SS1-7]
MSQPSSPILKARRQTHKLYSKMLYSILYSNHNITSTNSSSLTIIFPVTSASIQGLESHLHSLLRPSRTLVEVVLLSPRRYHPQIRKSLRAILSRTDDLDLEFSLAQWLEGTSEGAAVIMAGQRATTDWVLLADAGGFRSLDATTRDYLLLNNPSHRPLPIGPRGVVSNSDGSTCLVPSSLPQQASYLVPPLVLPTFLLPDTLDAKYTREPWIALGDHISRISSDLSGGTVFGSPALSSAWCLHRRHEGLPSAGTHASVSTVEASPDSSQFILQGEIPATELGSFLMVVHEPDLRRIAPIACSNARQGHQVKVIALSNSTDAAPSKTADLEECTSLVTVQPVSLSARTLYWSGGELRPLLAHKVDVLISAVEEDVASWFLAVFAEMHPATDSTPVDIRIPREDLPYCDWMAAVDIGGWKNWHVPQIELSVITDSRPYSLRRLLSSLTNARYFGDALNLRMNVEQTADEETLRLVSDFEWASGETFLHHRVVHGGLMTSVVESWYPQNNDSYGLILEDDVELSPLFYAWVKMSLLRYRYGRPNDRNPNMFGISLYQQKNLELHPEGRHLFDARSSFKSAGLSHPDTPYLSQIPCSWGAVYFPEQWREFHTYLTTRLTSAVLPLSEAVVPEVRSNRWTRSWKKYFIELVYLRGYVMLYPNYADFASLSTNHLEAGSHVKYMPAEAHARKKKLFTVPLMSLPPASAAETRTGLLELPDARLPEWNELPILDLLGTIVDEETLAKRGRERRTQLTGCDGMLTQPHNVRDLLCIH